MSNNNHIQVTVLLQEPFTENSEIASAFFTSIDYTGFVEDGNTLLAYIPVNEFNKVELTLLIQDLAEKGIVYQAFDFKEIEDKNWNEVWEQNYFQPIGIKNKLYVRGSFHQPDSNYKNEIIIDPKMSFGTGHHQTTKMMLESLIETDLKNKSVLDMGTGTGILAIYTAQNGAKSITAVDIDEWAVENSVENFQLNNLQKEIEVYKGDARVLNSLNRNFDIFIANINLGVLLDDAEIYIKHLNKGGVLFLSGFLTTDIQAIQAAFPLQMLDTKTDGDWAMLKMIK